MEDANVVQPDYPETKGRRTRQARAEALRHAAQQAREDAKAERLRLRQLASDLEQKAAKLERTDRVRQNKQRSQDERRIGREVVNALAALVKTRDHGAQDVAQRIVKALGAADRTVAERLLALTTPATTAVAGEV